MNLFFKDNTHQQELIKKLKELNQIHETGVCDPYYLSALYILTSDDEFRHKSYRFIKAGINFESIVRSNDFSSSYKHLLKLAWNLFNYHGKLNMADMIDCLDASNIRLMITALSLRNYRITLSDLIKQDKDT